MCTQGRWAPKPDKPLSAFSQAAVDLGPDRMAELRKLPACIYILDFYTILCTALCVYLHEWVQINCLM